MCAEYLSAGEDTLQGRASMAAEVIHTLRGKVITKNERKVEYVSMGTSNYSSSVCSYSSKQNIHQCEAS